MHNSVTAQPHPRHARGARGSRRRDFRHSVQNVKKVQKPPSHNFQQPVQNVKKVQSRDFEHFSGKGKKRPSRNIGQNPPQTQKKPPQPRRNPSVTPDNPRARRRPPFVHRAQFAFSNGPAPAFSNGQAPACAPAPARTERIFPSRPACLARVRATHYARTHAQAPVLSSEDINISDAPLRQASEASGAKRWGATGAKRRSQTRGRKGRGGFLLYIFFMGRRKDGIGIEDVM